MAFPLDVHPRRVGGFDPAAVTTLDEPSDALFQLNPLCEVIRVICRHCLGCPVIDALTQHAQAAGTFRIYQLYTDVKGDPWRPETVQVEYIEPGGAEQHLRIAGDELVM